MTTDQRDLTRLLNDRRSDQGQGDANLWLLVEAELRRLARWHLRGERGNPLLQTTMLVDEVFLKLRAQDRVQWSDRTHFFAIAARLVRRTLVDWARGEQREKRGAAWRRVELDPEIQVPEVTSCGALIELEEALTKLSRGHPRAARVVELKFFAGLSVGDIARALNVSPRTVNDDWTFARTWLFREMARGAPAAHRQTPRASASNTATR